MKPLFFFRDSIQEDDSFMFEGGERWLRVVNDMRIFLPGMQRLYGLTYLQSASIPRQMDWHLVSTFAGMTIGKLVQTNVAVVGNGRGVVSLLPSSVQKSTLRVRSPNEPRCSSISIWVWMVTTLLRCRLKVGCFPLASSGGHTWLVES